MATIAVRPRISQGAQRSTYSELDPPSSASAVNAGTNARAAPRPIYQSFLNFVFREPMDATSARFHGGPMKFMGPIASAYDYGKP